MYNCTDLNICEFCSSDELSLPKSKCSIIKLSINRRLLLNSSRVSTYKQNSIKKKEIHPLFPIQTQPGSLTKFTRKRSAFKLLDICLNLVCRTFNTLQPYKVSINQHLSIFKNTNFRSTSYFRCRLFQSLIEEGTK